MQMELLRSQSFVKATTESPGGALARDVASHLTREWTGEESEDSPTIVGSPLCELTKRDKSRDTKSSRQLTRFGMGLA
jgi:hypothetical protein